jgi:hypothetical protein
MKKESRNCKTRIRIANIRVDSTKNGAFLTLRADLGRKLLAPHRRFSAGDCA